MKVGHWVRDRPFLAFCILTFAITWSAWWPMAAYNNGWTDVHLPALYFVGGLGPGIAAYVVMRILFGSAADSALLGPLLRWRVGWGWCAVAVLLVPALWVLSARLTGTLGSELAALGSLSAVAVSLVQHLLAAVPEEIGWRGFALPALQARYSALTSSFIVGLLWAAWHLPLVLDGDPLMSTYPLIPYAVWFLAQAVLYTWLYNNTGGSLFIAVLLHGLANFFGSFSTAPFIATALTLALALTVITAFGAPNLSKTRPRLTVNGLPGLSGLGSYSLRRSRS